MVIHYIGADVHCNNTELAVEQKGRIVRRYSVATTVRAIRDVLDEIGGTRHLALEEGPLAGWLYRNLVDQVDTLVVCNPRRNKLIAEDDGDKDDPIDAAKLATLLRGGYLRPVYHSRDEDRVRFKEWVALYHDRVEAATRGINQIRACGRLHGIAIPRRVLRDAQARETWLGSLESEDLAEQFRMVWMSYETAAVQVQHTRTRLRDLARAYPIIGDWTEVPGMGWIRSITLFAYLDTPWRFRKKNQLWKYCGVGLQRTTSGRDAKGRPRPAQLKLAWAVNRRLKNVVIGAALTAIHSRDNVFRQDYERRVAHGMKPCNARHTVARKLLAVLWGMWKTNRRFEVSSGRTDSGLR